MSDPGRSRLAARGWGSRSGRVHGSYLRFPADLPLAARRVVLRLRVQRFTCEVVSCGRRTFVEQVTGLSRRHRAADSRQGAAESPVLAWRRDDNLVDPRTVRSLRGQGRVP
ncbi:transposase family protein [Kitasatospora sp. NPDC127116]|uniref:transposase family protein n=1 Tax=Kitasatospora sp. NPDC127116 TaxID=3345367 RepID=UPI00363D52DF